VCVCMCVCGSLCGCDGVYVCACPCVGVFVTSVGSVYSHRSQHAPRQPPPALLLCLSLLEHPPPSATSLLDSTRQHPDKRHLVLLVSTLPAAVSQRRACVRACVCTQNGLYMHHAHVQNACMRHARCRHEAKIGRLRKLQDQLRLRWRGARTLAPERVVAFFRGLCASDGSSSSGNRAGSSGNSGRRTVIIVSLITLAD
jgi:hypothetical protein